MKAFAKEFRNSFDFYDVLNSFSQRQTPSPTTATQKPAAPPAAHALIYKHKWHQRMRAGRETVCVLTIQTHTQ